jgi:hypothetical protein
VNRQIRFLAERFRVTAAGFADPCVQGVEYVHIPYSPRSYVEKARAVALLKLGMFEKFYWSFRTIGGAFQALQGKAFDLTLANDLSSLPLACALRSGCGVLFDAHEYSPREYEESFSWRFLFQRYNDYLCRTYIPKAAGMLTVCQGIAEAYRSNYGADAKVMFNAPPYHELTPGPVNAGPVRMIHHGRAAPERSIELMIEVMDLLDDHFRLDLMLVPGEPRYYKRLESLAARRPRVRMVPTTPMRELPRRLNEYDVGLYLLPPSSFNNQYALPNKFFEFIQARLALAIGPSLEMANLIRQHDCGIVAEDFSPQSLADGLNQLDANRIDYFKRQSHLAAKELCFEKGSAVLLSAVNRLLGG